MTVAQGSLPTLRSSRFVGSVGYHWESAVTLGPFSFLSPPTGLGGKRQRMALHRAAPGKDRPHLPDERVVRPFARDRNRCALKVVGLRGAE